MGFFGGKSGEPFDIAHDRPFHSAHDRPFDIAYDRPFDRLTASKLAGYTGRGFERIVGAWSLWLKRFRQSRL